PMCSIRIFSMPVTSSSTVPLKHMDQISRHSTPRMGECGRTAQGNAGPIKSLRLGRRITASSPAPGRCRAVPMTLRRGWRPLPCPGPRASSLAVLQAGALVGTPVPVFCANEVQRLVDLPTLMLLVTGLRFARRLDVMQLDQATPAPAIITYGSESTEDL